MCKITVNRPCFFCCFACMGAFSCHKIIVRWAFICIFPTVRPNAGTVTFFPSPAAAVCRKATATPLSGSSAAAPGAPTPCISAGAPRHCSPLPRRPPLIEAADPLPGAEITLEANPDVVSAELLQGFRAAGVTRISFGVQSADDAQLRRLGRTHTAAGAAQALQWAADAGFEEICGDIMLALPGYTREEFDRTLALLKNGGCTHISAYLLKIEPGTAFYKNPPDDLPDADAAADFYLYAVQRLAEEGYPQYEISNFARPEHRGRHNLLYWDCQDYLGIGPAAHSCMENRRSFWPTGPHAVEAFIAGTLAEEFEGVCNTEDYLMLRLRLRDGLDLGLYRERFGGHFTDKQLAFIRHCAAAGYAQFDGQVLRLTPEGLVVENSILAELLPEE